MCDVLSKVDTNVKKTEAAEYLVWQMQNTAGFSQCCAVQLESAVGDRQAKLYCLHIVTRKFLPQCLKRTMRRTDYTELNKSRKTGTPGANSKRRGKIVVCLIKQNGPGSSVVIVIGYGLEGPGVESRWGRDFPHLSTPALRPTQPPVQWVPCVSRG